MNNKKDYQYNRVTIILDDIQLIHLKAVADNEYGGNISLAVRKLIDKHIASYAKKFLSTKNVYPCPNCKRPMKTWTEANGPDDYKWVGYCEHCKEQFDE